MDLLEDLYHWGQALGFQNTPTSLYLSLPPAFGSKCELSATVSVPCLPAYCHDLCSDGYEFKASETVNPKETLSSKIYLGHGVLSQSEKELRHTIQKCNSKVAKPPSTSLKN